MSVFELGIEFIDHTLEALLVVFNSKMGHYSKKLMKNVLHDAGNTSVGGIWLVARDCSYITSSLSCYQE